MNRILCLVAVVALAAVLLAGCGGGGGSAKVDYRIGSRLGVAVYMDPPPPNHNFLPWSGTGPDIRVEEVVQFTSVVHPAGTSIYHTTYQVAFGRVLGSPVGKRVVIYSKTTSYYVQPLTQTTIDIRSDGTWVAPANPGAISALLVRDGYIAPDTTFALPVVDNVNVFAVATGG